MAGRVSRRTVLAATAATGAVAAGAGAFAFWGGRGGWGEPTPSGTPGATPGAATPGVAPSPAATPMPVVAGAPDGYIAVAPRVLRAGQAESVSLALFKGDQPARDTVSVALLKDGRAVADASGEVVGRGALALRLPALARATIS
jgi:hypothetical protein